jgi:acyl dehydratase
MSNLTRQDPISTPNVQELPELVGKDLGASEWVTIEQKDIDLFAEATRDHQWIHVDPEAAKDGPFGATIAHGFFTLSLCPWLLAEILEVQGANRVVNYGLNKVRFPAPLLVNSRMRLSVTLNAADPVEGGIQAALGMTFEIEGSDRPACVAEMIVRYLE